MGKRGPAPKGEYAGKTTVLSTRIRPDTKAWLDREAKAHGWSLSQEIEHRLRRTFYEDHDITHAFGNRRHYKFMRMLHDMIEMVAASPGGAEVDWLDDPYRFGQAAQAASAVFQLLRPAGEQLFVGSSDASDDASRLNSLLMGAQGTLRAMQYLQAIHQADPGLPLKQGSVQHHVAAGLKIDLGDVVSRAKGRKSAAGSLELSATRDGSTARSDASAKPLSNPICSSKNPRARSDRPSST